MFLKEKNTRPREGHVTQGNGPASRRVESSKDSPHKPPEGDSPAETSLDFVLQSCKGVHFYSLKLPSLWSLVMGATGNEDRSLLHHCPWIQTKVGSCLSPCFRIADSPLSYCSVLWRDTITKQLIHWGLSMQINESIGGHSYSNHPTLQAIPRRWKLCPWEVWVLSS